jgi:hypothetical protein
LARQREKLKWIIPAIFCGFLAIPNRGFSS